MGIGFLKPLLRGKGVESKGETVRGKAYKKGKGVGEGYPVIEQGFGAFGRGGSRPLGEPASFSFSFSFFCFCESERFGSVL